MCFGGLKECVSSVADGKFEGALAPVLCKHTLGSRACVLVALPFGFNGAHRAIRIVRHGQFALEHRIVLSGIGRLATYFIVHAFFGNSLPSVLSRGSISNCFATSSAIANHRARTSASVDCAAIARHAS